MRPLYKNKTDFLNFFTYMCVIVLGGCCFYNPDYEIYKADYENEWFIFEPIFNSMMKLSKRLNFSYAFFVFLLVFICIVLLKVYLEKYINSQYLFMISFFLSPFPLLLTQIRSLVAYICLYILISKYLLGKKNKVDDIKYIVGIMLLALIHKTMIFYMILIIAKHVRLSRIVKVICFYLIISVMCFRNDLFLSRFTYLLSHFFQREKINQYFYNFNARPNFNGLLCTVVLYFIGLFVLMFIVYEKYIWDRSVTLKEYIQNEEIEEVCFFKYYLCVAVILPFMMYGTVFERFYFYLYPIIYLFLIRAYEYFQNDVIKKSNICILMIVVVGYAFFYMSYVNGLFYDAFITMFKNNYLFL